MAPRNLIYSQELHLSQTANRFVAEYIHRGELSPRESSILLKYWRGIKHFEVLNCCDFDAHLLICFLVHPSNLIFLPVFPCSFLCTSLNCYTQSSIAILYFWDTISFSRLDRGARLILIWCTKDEYSLDIPRPKNSYSSCLNVIPGITRFKVLTCYDIRCIPLVLF